MNTQPSRLSRPEVMMTWLEAQNIPSFQELERLKDLGWKSRELDKTYNRPLGVSIVKRKYLWIMKDTFQELIDAELIVNIDKDQLKYLDIGCHPGGFSFAILERNLTAIGEGIALPESQGGIPCLLPPNYRARIHIHSQDLTRFNFTPKQPDKPVPVQYSALPFQGTKFDLILLDAHRFETGNETPVKWEPNRMLLSQLIIALENTALGGIVVIRLSNPQHDQTAAVLYILSLLFRTLQVLKPIGAHKHRGSFYAVAAGFQHDVIRTSTLVSSVTRTMRRHWWDATFGGKDGNGVDPFLWWEEIVPANQLPRLFGEKLVQLSMPLWKTQIEGLKEYFTRNEIKL